MKFQKEFDFFIYLNFWVATGAFLQTLFYSLILGTNNAMAYSIVVFLGTLFLYNVQLYIKHLRIKNKALSLRHDWIAKNTQLVLFSGILSGLLIIPFLFFMDSGSLLFLSLAGLIGLMYTGYKRGLREIPQLKIWLVAGTWTFICVIIPSIAAENYLNYFFTIRFFLLLFSIALLFDLRDIGFDPKRMKTLPQKLGKLPTLLLVEFLLMVNCLLSGLYLTPAFFLADLATLIIATPIVIKIFNKESETLYSFYADGLLITNAIANFLFFYLNKA